MGQLTNSCCVSGDLLPVGQVQGFPEDRWRGFESGQQRGHKLLDELHRLAGDQTSRHCRNVIVVVRVIDAVFDSDDATFGVNEEDSRRQERRNDSFSSTGSLSSLPNASQNNRLAAPTPTVSLPSGAPAPGTFDILTNPIYQCMSLPESRAKTLCRKQPQRMLEHTESQLVRVYPAGMRIDSSNFNPVPFWSCGIQMAVS